MRAKGGARGKFSLGRSLRVGLLGHARPTSPRPLECPTKHPSPAPPKATKFCFREGH